MPQKMQARSSYLSVSSTDSSGNDHGRHYLGALLAVTWHVTRYSREQHNARSTSYYSYGVLSTTTIPGFIQCQPSPSKTIVKEII